MIQGINVADWLTARGVSPEFQTKLLLTAITIGALWALHRVVLGLAYRRLTDPWTRYRWRKGVSYAALVIGVIVIGRTWIPGMQTLATFLGLLSAGLAIALKDPVSNFAAWVFIAWARPFEVGDRIQIGAHAGDVIDLRLLQFTLNEIGNWVDADQSTGRIIHIPNGRVFTEPVANYDKGFKYIWNEVQVVVTFESNWRKAKEILTAIAFKHAEHLTAQAEEDLLTASRQYLINYRKLTPIVYTKAIDSGVQLSIRYLIEPRKRRGTEHAIWEDVLTEFDATPDIDLAYHTVRSFKYTEEGKPALFPVKPARRPPVKAPIGETSD
jgi:small-conductance mechanosensitive channel